MRCIRFLVATVAGLLAGCNDVPDDLVAVGTLEWHRIELTARVAEPVVAWETQEGVLVERDQLLLRLDDRRLQARVRAADAACAQAAARLAELERGTRDERIALGRARLAGAEEALQFQQRELQRLTGLLERRLIAPERVDQVRTAVVTARAERDAARASLDELEQGATQEERDQVRQALAVATAELESARLDLAHATVRAPVAGRLDELPFRVGERPAAGAVIAVILSGARPYARVYVPEPLRVHLVPGSRAQVDIDGLDETFEGAVRKISADPSFTPYFALTEQDRGRLSYVAEIDIEPGDRTLPAGVPVQARFPAAAAQD